MPSRGAPLEFLESILDRMEANTAVKPDVPVVNHVPRNRRMTEGLRKKLNLYRELFFDIID